MQSKFCTDKKSGKKQPSVKKYKQYRTCYYHSIMYEKKQFRSEIFSWYTPTNGKTFLRGRLLSMFELIICSVSDYSKRLPKLVFRCCETRWGNVCFSPSPLLRRNCSVGESPTRFRLLLFRHWHQMWYIPILSKSSFYKKKTRLLSRSQSIKGKYMMCKLLELIFFWFNAWN